MKKLSTRLAVLTLAVCFAEVCAFAEHTRRWRQSTYEEFLKGTARGVAVRSDGHFELAPRFTLLADADASYLWSLKVDKAGALYTAGGSPAKVFRFDGSGKPSTVFESTDLIAHSIAFDAKGALYVGTSPDGKVYKVSANGEKTVFFDPKTKYIWDLAFGADGTLYVATGDKGQLFAVSPDGKGEIFYASDEAHIKVLGFDSKGNLLAGTEPNGRVLRIAKSEKGSKKKPQQGIAEGFVLYETAKKEVTSIALAADGSIYVAAIGEKQKVGPPGTAVITTAQGTTTVTNIQPGQPQGGAPFVAFPAAISSSVYRITAEGAPEELWTSREEVVYSLGLDADGRLLAGTGNSGSLLSIDGRGVYAQLAKAGSSQITGIARANGGKMYLCTANPGKVFSLGPEFEAEGTFESQPFDAKLFSQWGRIEWWGPAIGRQAKNAQEPKQPYVEFYVRSGNTEDPGKEWSEWFGPYAAPNTQVEAPAARFLQWKAVIHDGRADNGIDWVSVTYLPKNVAPVIDGIAVEEPGLRAQAAVGAVGPPMNVPLKQPPTQAPTPSGIPISTTTAPKFELQPQGVPQRGYQSVLWSAHDENDDELRYSVYYRGENQRDWLLLKENVDQKFYSWDTTTMPDGAYYLKIVASDAPSNPPSLALKTERESERFEVDNTPPAIGKVEAIAAGVNAERSRGVSYDISFTANHPTMSIERAQYSVDGGEWIPLAPTAGITDYKTEKYAFTVHGLAPGEHTVAVRAYDRFENVGVGKATFTVAGTKN
jgi:hypothetical protein